MYVSPIAKKYAHAFMNIYSSALSETDLIAIQEAQQFLQTHKRILFFLQLPQCKKKVAEMVEDLMRYFTLPHVLASLFLLLIQHNRSFYIPAVLFFIGVLYRTSRDIVHFLIISSHRLTGDQRAGIEAFLAYITHKNSTCTYMVQKKVIAGIRMQSDEYIWEYSVRKQLASLRALNQ
jgi:ATP synthase F1 delta subunit